jgi:uncharacterized Zn finger protein
MGKCSYCGEKLTKGSSYCHYCGMKVEIDRHSLLNSGREGRDLVYKCPRCGLVYEKEEKCPSCEWPINVPFNPEKHIQRKVPRLNCPECGKEMEHGVLQIQNESLSLSGYGMRWFPEDEKVVHGLGGEFFHLYWIRKPGAICRGCGLVILRWEDLARPEEPIPDKP